MDGIVINRRRFGWFLEAWGPGADGRRRALGLSEQDAEELGVEFSGRILGPSVTLPDIEAVLGSGVVGRGLVTYDLGVRTSYDFAFEIVDGRIGEAGYVWKHERTWNHKLLATRQERESLRHELSSGGASWNEVRALLGTPLDRIGWWPIEQWEYPSEFVLDLRLGVVEEVGSDGSYSIPRYVER
jgi:hypothetical protein